MMKSYISKYAKGNVKGALLLSAALALSANLQAQDLRGKVVGNDGQPVANVVISMPGKGAVRTDANGMFTIKDCKENAQLTFRHEGYFNKTEHLKKQDLGKQIVVHLISNKTSRYNESVVLPHETVENDPTMAGRNNINRKDFALGSMTVEKAMQSGLPGLRVVNKGGNPGEGANMQIRGLKTIIGDGNPLVVINGVPFMPDKNESKVIGGLSRSIFEALNGQDIKNITVLKDGATAIYGSLANNGVVLIETDQASKENMNTRISFNAIYGFNWNKSRLPLMNSTQYKSYLTDMGLTHYANQEAFFNDFTFLSNPHANNAELYSFNTNWQDEVLRNSSTMDYLFRVEGGDAIAKYNISLGYNGDQGTLKNTNNDRYNAQINASVLVSRKLEILASVNTAYMKGNFMEQGMSYEANPMLAAYRRSPLLSPYSTDIYGKLISNYSTYKYGAIDDYYVSNPLAVVNTVEATQKQYDVNAKVQLVYRPAQWLTLNGIVGLYYNYNQENMFIPGVTSQAIKFITDRYGNANNTVRVGTNYTMNMFYHVNADFQKTFAKKHDVKVQLGFQALTTDYEYDVSFGRNTPNDYLKTMGSVPSSEKRYFDGYNNKWNWMNLYAVANYTYANLAKVGLTASLDGASSVAGKFGDAKVYPGADVVLMVKNLPGLHSADFINKLNLYANCSTTGNSRFGSKYYQSYYTSSPFLDIAGIVRANLATTDVLKPEITTTYNVGIETALFNNRISLAAEYYNSKTKDVILFGNASPLLGTAPYYRNAAKIKGDGVELKVSVSPVVTKDFKWTLGATLSTVNNQVESMNGAADMLYSLSDNATLITRQGESPFAFYGYQTAGVYSTTAEANAAYTQADGSKTALLNDRGVAYQAGDIRFVDQNGDGRIDAADRVVLGSATPKGFGNFYTHFDYKNFGLDVDFGYQWGGKAYNAMRRVTESASDFSNQSVSVVRRWNMEGQVTDMPHAEWGDPRGDNDFSDRWIESTDFIKLRNISLSYTYDKSLWNFIQGATIYVSGENLLTFTKYLGLDPEFSYSYSNLMQGVDYGKLNAPRSVKIGVNLKF